MKKGDVEKAKKPTLNEGLICKPITDGDFLPFIWRTQNLGRAEFQICPQYKRGKLVKLSIYPKQQVDRSYYYEWSGEGRRELNITSYSELKDPKVWLFFYCKEHKCQTMRVYVPTDSKFIWFQVFSDHIGIGFTKEQW